MATDRAPLPLTDTIAPATQDELAAAVRRAAADRTPLYPIGGGTALDYGLVPRAPGLGLALAGVNRLIDYPARDMTITVESGLTMAALSAVLAAQRQRLPVDAADAQAATIGGVIATNFSGPRRYGHGTIRDYVIGISAVDGRGTPFKGGGRVVKNVAGYDFCKLLTGSLGTLAVITQVTLRVKPIPETDAFVACDLPDFDRAEALLAALVHSRTIPSAVELLCGPAWNDDPVLGPLAAGCRARLIVGLEGTQPEVEWMVGQLGQEWKELGVGGWQTVSPTATPGVWQRLIDFSAAGRHALVLKINVRPSAVCGMARLLAEAAPGCSLQAHAASGIIVARWPQFSPAADARLLIGRIQPAAVAAGGQAVVWSCAAADELTRQAVWGPTRDDLPVLQAVKHQFDPHGILNPGRFIV